MFMIPGVIVLLSASSVSAASVSLHHLRVEYRPEPLGLDTALPRFSWQIAAEERNWLQRAYRIVVAASEEALEREEGLLWDSGKVLSDNTVLIPYAGAPLESRMRCWWKVRVWDSNDAPTSWSEPARFGLAFLDENAWTARWIGDTSGAAPDYESALTLPMTAAQWVWHAEGNPREDAPAGDRWFRGVAHLPEDASIVHARLQMAADDVAAAWINGVTIGQGRPPMAGHNRVYQHLVAARLRPGKNILAIRGSNNGGPAGVIATLRVTLSNGDTVSLVTDASWKSAAAEPPEEWTAVEYDDSAWAGAMEVAAFGDAPWAEARLQPAQFRPVAHLRRNFEAGEGLRRATLHATALGLFECRINGERVGDSFFTPGWTDYKSRLYYHTFEVTDLIRAGAANTLGALLANGWYAGHVAHVEPGVYGHQPAFLAQLELEYTDGRRETVVTDGDWHVAHGEIRGSDIIMGETRDKRLALTGWDTPEYDASHWASAPEVSPEIAPARLQAYPGAPVRQFEELPARGFTEPQPGVYVYDMGQNMVGWPRIRVSGNSGQIIRVRHTEMLRDDGMVYTDALRSAQSCDLYHLAGEGEELLEPAFTFHGFRYIELRGLSGPLAAEAVVGVVLNADVPIAADFETSNPLLNQLASNIVWGLKGNYLEAPTDCPQRDERLGWTGDAQFFMTTALYTAEIGAFFTKWLTDLIQDGQLEDGSFPHVAPDIGLGGGAVAWGDAAMTCPWLIYQFYGDTRLIEQHYDRMARGMDFLERTSRNHIRKRLGFGDWLNLGGGAKDEVICTAFYAYLAEIMSKMGAIIGRDEDADRYAALHGAIRAAFIDAFVDDDGRLLESSQTGYALAFAFDLIPEHLREAAAQRYVEEIERFDGHLATGFIGTPRLLPTLTQAGRDDVAWRLLMNTTYPSWLYQVTLGATTMWERWNGWTPEKGFETPDMNSFNHYAFGAVGEWLYGRVAGIKPDAPGFSRIRIEPLPGGGVTHARLTYRSIRGPITSAWRVEEGVLTLDVDIPANTTALVCVPTSDPDSLREGGLLIGDTAIPVIASDAASVICTVGSGRYRFEAAAPR